MKGKISDATRQKWNEIERQYEERGWLTARALYAKLPPIVEYKNIDRWCRNYSVRSHGNDVKTFPRGCGRGVVCVRVERAQKMIDEYWAIYREMGEGDKLVGLRYLRGLVPYRSVETLCADVIKAPYVKIYKVTGIKNHYSRKALDRLASELNHGKEVGENGVPVGYVSEETVTKQMKWYSSLPSVKYRLMSEQLWKERIKVNNVCYYPRKMVDKFISRLYDEFEEKTGGDVFGNYVRAGDIVERMPSFSKQKVWRMLSDGFFPFRRVKIGGSDKYLYYKKDVDEYFKANP